MLITVLTILLLYYVYHRSWVVGGGGKPREHNPRELNEAKVNQVARHYRFL